MQRPLRSQSPKRVGSGPEGPPISRGGVAIGTAGTGWEGTEGGVEELFSGLIGIYYKCARIQLPRP